MSDKLANPDEDFFKGITIRDMLEIAKLATQYDFDWENYDLSKLTFAVYQQTPNIRNGFDDYQYAQMNIPLKSNNGEYNFGFELKFFEDGYISYENGMDVKMRMTNPIECYKILSEKMKEVTKPISYEKGKEEYKKRYEAEYGTEEPPSYDEYVENCKNKQT